MAEIYLNDIAHGRSGDKGDTSNVCVYARKPEYYKIIEREVTPEKLKAYFGDMVKGEITRYDASVTFQHALNETERTAFAALCEEEAKEYLFVAEKSADASAGSTVKTTNVVCPASGSVEGFVDLHEKDKTPVAYPENGACVISR